MYVGPNVIITQIIKVQPINQFFQKKLKNLLQFTFEKNNLCKERKKITCHEEKSQPP